MSMPVTCNLGVVFAEQEKQLAELRPSYAKKNKLPDTVIRPGTKTHKAKFAKKLTGINRLSDPAKIEEVVGNAFPNNVYTTLYGKMSACYKVDDTIFFGIDIFKSTVTETKADPLVLPYLAWLPKDSEFVRSYLGKTTRIESHSHISFSMQVDPTIMVQVAFR